MSNKKARVSREEAMKSNAGPCMEKKLSIVSMKKALDLKASPVLPYSL
jgi:hypothetical protein